MKLDNNWKQKNLEELEDESWGQPNYDSYLVTRCHELRKIPLDKYSVEDLRLMIGQQFSLEYLIPIALDVLSVDLFAEGDYFKGDLLKNVLSIKTQFWNENKGYWLSLNTLIKNHRDEIHSLKFDTEQFDNCVHKN